MLSILGGITLLVIIGAVVLVLVKKNKGGGLLGRAANLAEGKADRAIEDLEKSDPEAIFRSAINETEEEVAEMNKLSKEVKGLEFQERQKVADIEEAIEDTQSMLDVALEQEEEELGSELCTKIESLEEQKAEYLKMADVYKDQAADTLALLDSKKKELDELRVEMKQASNITKSAEIINRVRDRQNGLANDAVSKGLSSARDKIAESKASLAADKDIEDNSTENKMAKLKKAGAANSGKNKFKEMMAAKKAAAKKE